LRGVWRDPQSDTRRFNAIFVAVVPSSKGFGCEPESDGSSLTGGERHPLEGPQCSDGLRDAGALKSDVKLSYFLAGSVPSATAEAAARGLR